ncbi:MAG: hypothetical protein Q9182_006222 [Xanthomendoza sp. 2 TL-2023]
MATSADPTLDLYGHTVPPAPTAVDAFSYFSNDPIETDGIPATPIPTSSFSSPPPSHDNDQTNNNGILNYYFLLLALLIILLGILYLLFARRQRQKIAQRRQNGQRALARDLERWGGGGGPWGPGRFRMPRTHGTRQPRREEGLDERGEAPPPYIPKEPERTYAGNGAAREIPLQDLSRMDHKPPDYDEGPSSTPTRGRGTVGMGRGE